MEKKAGGIKSRMRSTSAGRVRRESTAAGTGAGRSGEGIAGKAVWMIKSLLCAYVVTGIFLLILTLLLYKMGLSEENVNAGITLIYVISTFAGGFVMGKLTGSRKFLWGLLAGILYFLLLVLISLGLYHSLQSEISGLITTFLLCAGGGMLGGMIA
nr:TIGR04086 family membrane protein [Lachnoclostridium sp. An169]